MTDISVRFAPNILGAGYLNKVLQNLTGVSFVVPFRSILQSLIGKQVITKKELRRSLQVEKTPPDDGALLAQVRQGDLHQTHHLSPGELLRGQCLAMPGIDVLETPM